MPKGIQLFFLCLMNACLGSKRNSLISQVLHSEIISIMIGLHK